MSVTFRLSSPLLDFPAPSTGRLAHIEEEIELFSEATEKIDEAPVRRLSKEASSYEKLSQYESLDYHIIDNDLYKSEVENRTESNLCCDYLQRWLVSLIVGFAVGFVAFGVEWLINKIQEAKFSALSSVLYGSGLLSAWFLLCVINAGCATVGTLLILYVSPAANSSGLPAVKAYLNGVKVPQVFNLRTLMTKVVGCVSSVSTSMPVGSAGPMIHIGGLIGGGVSQSYSKTLDCEIPILKRFRNDRDRRDFIAIGSACGVSAAFGAPVGGTLFSMEEAASFWSPAMTWRTFFASMVAVFTHQILDSGLLRGSWFQFYHKDSVLFFIPASVSYNLFELLPFFLLGCFGGLFGAIFIKINLSISQWRMNWHARALENAEAGFPDANEQVVVDQEIEINGTVCRETKLRLLRIFEVLLITLVWTSMAFVAVELTGCSSNGIVPSLAPNITVPEPQFQVAGIHWRCLPNEYNEMAALLFASQKQALARLLASPRSLTLIGFGPLSSGVLSAFVVLYFGSSALIAGSTVASGLMVPLLLIGAAYGRLLGLFFRNVFGVAVQQEAYALIGAVSFFGGVSRMTISLTVIILEITNDMQFLLPIMVAAMTAKFVGDYLNHALYDNLLVQQSVPFLAPEAAPIFDLLSTRDVMSHKIVTIPMQTTVGFIEKVLRDTTHNGFPVHPRLAPFVFRGIILRMQLLVILEYRLWERPSLSSMDFTNLMMAFRMSIEQMRFTDQERDIQIDLSPYVNRSSFSLPCDFSSSIAFRLFRSMGLRHLTIVDERNTAVGMITRKDLIESIVELKYEALLHYHHLKMESGPLSSLLTTPLPEEAEDQTNRARGSSGFASRRRVSSGH